MVPLAGSAVTPLADRPAALLVDMDGTLVDSDAAVERAWTTWAADYAVDRAALLAVAHGTPAARTVRQVRPDLDAAGVARAAAHQLALQYDDLSDVRPAPGALDLVATLTARGLPWAVVTSADTRLAHARLAACAIAPPLVVTADDVAEGKPDPACYLLAAARLGVDPRTCLVVEDSAPGVAAGRAAGATVAALGAVQADVQIPDLHALVDLLGA